MGPYAYDLVKLLVKEDQTNAAFYAGLFFAAFSFSESLTGVLWGTLSDRIGRKPVLLLGCAGTIVSTLVIGLAQNVWVAVLGRALGGALNGNVGVVQTLVAELTRNPKHERRSTEYRTRKVLIEAARAYSIMPFFWSLGCTLGPAIGGTFARPVDAFPSVFGGSAVFSKFPYLLPNLVCAVLLLATIILNYSLLEETHPDKRKEKSRQKTVGDSYDEEEGPLLARANTENSYGATPEAATSKGSPVSKPKHLPLNVWLYILAACLLSVHTMSFVQLFPIFMEAKVDTTVSRYYIGGVGGLGRSLQAVGLTMGINGVIGFVVQGVIFPMVSKYLGIRLTFLLTTSLHPISYFTLPYIAFLPRNAFQEVGIYVWLTFRNIWTMLAYPTIIILLKRSTPSPLLLGRVNGLVTSLSAAWRTISPPVAGVLQSLGERHHLSALPWWAFGGVALVGAVEAWLIKAPDC